jgi:Flp pilus assembly protein TadG
VEFAIIGMVAMVVLFAVIEFSRMVFVVNSLSEATRRGARMAAVCPINDPAIAQVATFNNPGGGSGSSPVVNGLGTGNIAVSYLNAAGNPTADFMQIEYVQVRIVNFRHTLLVPMFVRTITLPAFASTLPRESLGVPRVGTGPLPC